MTDELREMQIQQLTLMQGTEGLISTCSKTKVRDYPDAPMNADGTRLLEINGDLIDVTVKFAIAFLRANEAHPLTPEEYREFHDQIGTALRLCVRARTVIRTLGLQP
jgi:hypothetical protein